jgi:ubiquitin-conjugating enzyme E2 D/E
MGCGAGQHHHVVYVAPRETENVALAGRPTSRVQSSSSSTQVAEADVMNQPSEDAKAMATRLRGSGLQACRRLGAELDMMIQESAAVDKDTAHRPFAMPRSLDTLLEWDARLYGPKQTPYEGGVFRLALWFSDTYPFAPPRAEFITPCFHPNVSDRGKICLNILKEEWSPMLTASSVLLCISGLLSQPNPEDPLNKEAADAFLRSPIEFEQTACEWTRRYAMRNSRSTNATCDSAGGVQASHANTRALGTRVRHGGVAPADDVSLDPMATYQTLDGRVLDEDEVLETVLRTSAMQPPSAKPCSSASRSGAIQASQRHPR